MTMTDEPTTRDHPDDDATGQDSTVEVVDATPADAVEVASRTQPTRDELVDAATDAIMAMPGLPSRDEFYVVAASARMLSLSGAAPEAIRNNPYVAFHVALVGRDLGISASAAIELIDVINTQKGPRLSLSPQLLNGQIRRLGLGSIVPVVQTPTRCVAAALRPGGRVDPRCAATLPEAHHDDCRCEDLLGVTVFDWAEAQTAGLVDKRCDSPGQHWKGQQSSCTCNFGYKTYPKRMMWWRASGFCADDYFPEAGLGLYTAEELGAVVDIEGRPIDVKSVELPAGYDDTTSAAAADHTVGDDEMAWLAGRVAALPEEHRQTLSDNWRRAPRLKGAVLPKGDRPGSMTRDQWRLASNMINATEAAARRAGWDGPSETPESPETPETGGGSEDPTEGENGVETPDPAPTAPDSDPGGDDTPPSGTKTPPTPGTPGESDTQQMFDSATETDDERHERHRAERREQMRAASLDAEAVRASISEAPAKVVDPIMEQVRTMHHTRINAMLADDFDLPTDGHIDARRMRLVAAMVDKAMGEPF